MEIESLIADLLGGKEVRVETLSKDETEMAKVVGLLRDAKIIELHHNTYNLPDNSVRLVLTLKVSRESVVEDWMRASLQITFTKTTLAFKRITP